jgi:hypothetical protein
VISNDVASFLSLKTAFLFFSYDCVIGIASERAVVVTPCSGVTWALLLRKICSTVVLRELEYLSLSSLSRTNVYLSECFTEMETIIITHT